MGSGSEVLLMKRVAIVIAASALGVLLFYRFEKARCDIGCVSVVESLSLVESCLQGFAVHSDIRTRNIYVNQRLWGAAKGIWPCVWQVKNAKMFVVSIADRSKIDGGRLAVLDFDGNEVNVGIQNATYTFALLGVNKDREVLVFTNGLIELFKR